MRIRLLVVMLLGAAAALLLARLVLRLLAARPDNLAIGWFLALSAPPRALAAMLDAGQPRFGATLEFSTLALILLCTVLALAIGRLGRRRARA